jgi:chromosome segregation ATPase
MSFFELQLLSSVAVIILRQIFVWLGPNWAPFLGFKFVDLTGYYFVWSWIFTAGYMIRDSGEGNKNEQLRNLTSQLERTEMKLQGEKNEAERKINSLKETNSHLKKIISSLEKTEKEFADYKIQNRSAKEANQHALKNFL